MLAIALVLCYTQPLLLVFALPLILLYRCVVYQISVESDPFHGFQRSPDGELQSQSMFHHRHRHISAVYSATATELRRLQSIARSPIYAHFSGA